MSKQEKTILDEIIDYKRKEVVSCKELFAVKELEKATFFNRSTLSLKESVLNPYKTGIITEFKRKSPSKGMINSRSFVDDVTQGYASAGASGLSILTDFNFFGGSIDDLMIARQTNQIPILRKEFIIDEYQVIEAKAYGADAILLIAAILSSNEIKNLYRAAKNLDLEVLLEIHDEDELEKVNGNADLIGINNRNLKTFEVDLERSKRLVKQLPSGMPKIAESGISKPETIIDLKNNGFDGFLIGENFMKTNNPGRAFNEFINQLHGVKSR
ncbi:MAG: indole-3-glycerol phosphate synthase TrpC [Bacteroidales bacterium]|nr:indole-3-glycerol phosphate synthase TrpC [Bacteroidales bacterium]MBN2818079.1 indole-3-glycerol phosphate synthase TrpC [Bacteroidales bacterium]